MRYEDRLFSGQACHRDVMLERVAEKAIVGLKETKPVLALGGIKNDLGRGSAAWTHLISS